MFGQINTITIKGAAFSDSEYPRGVRLDILKHRLNLVYGKNGSGKSSIASAIKYFAVDQPASDVSISFDGDIQDSDRKEIHVFNEEFIHQNFLWKQNGLKNIVMVGSANVDLCNQIQSIEKLIIQKRKDLSGIEEEIGLLVDKKKADSVEAAKTALVTALRDSGFEDRTVRLKNIGAAKPQTSIRINDNLLDAISMACAAGVAGSVDDMKARFEQCLTILQSGAASESKIYWLKPTVEMPNVLEGIDEFLGRELLRPELTERELQIFSRFDDARRSMYLRQASEDIVQAEAAICPLCHQPIDERHRASLSEVIKRLLGDEARDLEEKLKRAYSGLGEVAILAPAFPKNLYADHVHNLDAACALFNKELAAIRNAVDERIKDVYKASSYRYSKRDFEERIKDVTAALDALEKDVKEYNKSIDGQSGLRIEAERLNLQIAYLEMKIQVENYVKAKERLGKATQKQSIINGEIGRLIEQRNDLGMKMQQTETACNYINAQLSNVFFSNDRLVLKGSSKGEYVLYSRGRIVPPGKVSTGERNVIALAYFFATLFSGKAENNKYSDKPMLVVIDDPVSSFDYGNRTGIISYLGSEIQHILSGNTDSKVLVLSHDLQTINHLSHLSDKNEEYRFYELSSGRLFGVKMKDNEYWRMLQDVFRYANGQGGDDEGIGNKMRRVLETFSTFMFQCGFKDMFGKDYLYENIPSGRKDFYMNFVGRVILDAMSHSENQVNTLDFTTSLFTKDEKVNTAKGIIRFMHYVSPTHLKAYLNQYGQYDTVLGWIEEEKDSAN